MKDQEDHFLILVKAWFQELLQVATLKCQQVTVL